jgi:hypothetical protein
MNDDREIDFVRKHLRASLPPLDDAELDVDLWPQMLCRLEEPPAAFGWFEAVLAGLVAIAFVIYPQAILAMLYHL